jgi:hypothetical protein
MTGGPFYEREMESLRARARARAAHPASGSRIPLRVIAGGSGGPAERRFIVTLLSPIEVWAPDEDAAAAAAPALLLDWLRDSAGIAEFDVAEGDS